MSPIVLITQPRSGGIYVKNALCQGLGRGQKTVSPGLFLHDAIDIVALRDCIEGSLLCQTHSPASEINKRSMNALSLQRLVVTVRDPRQSLVSWMHHMEDTRLRTPLVLFKMDSGNQPDDDYFNLTVSKKLDWLIKNYLPSVVKWLEGWVDADSDPDFNPKILFKTHEQLATDPKKYFQSILDFYGYPQAQFSDPRPPRARELNFRLGKTDEWKTVMNKKQQQAATKALPNSLVSRFGWG